MKTNIFKLSTTLTIIALSIIGCTKNDNDYNTNYDPQPGGSQAKVMSAAGDSAAIIGTVNQFRTLLGDPLNVAPGATSGRREVNWDAVPAAFTNQNNFPFDFFGSSVDTDPNGKKRGLVLTNTGTSFRVDSTDFAEVDPSYANQFDAFSKKRTFVYMGNNVTGVTFKVPGSATNASIKGFGVIFSDVDNAQYTTLELFDGSKSLGKYKVPTRNANGGFSFLGVYFENEKVTSVKITAGNGLLATGTKDISDGGSVDLVVMDDFFYSEPSPQ